MLENENVINKKEDFIKKAIGLNQLMGSTTSGKEVSEAAKELHQLDQMQKLLNKINNPIFGKNNQLTLSSYLNELLNDDIENGLEYFSTLMQLFVKEREFEIYAEYLNDIAKCAIELNKTIVFQNYAKASKLFDKDDSEQAKQIKEAMTDIGSKYSNWVLENPDTYFINNKDN